MIRNGVDIIENDRIERALERFGARFLNRIFTPAEQAQARGRVKHLAARFAAKEAVSKMLGTGIGPVSWIEMEVLDGLMGAPILTLHGRAKEWAARIGLEEWSVSMSHIDSYSVATASGIGSYWGVRNMDLKPGLTVEKTITVTSEQTAQHVGSGDLRVFATPEMVWLLESVCTDFVAEHLGEGKTSVGVMVNIRHLAPTPVGMKVKVKAELTGINGNLLSFQVVLHDEIEKIGEAEHTRAVIDADRFLKRVMSKSSSS